MTDYISIGAVYDILDGTITPLTRTERLALAQAEGAVTAEALTAPFDAPPFTNAAMDGFAFRSEELACGETVHLSVAGTAYAGAPFEGRLPEGAAVRIMTGAPVPEDADTVIPFERTREVNGGVLFDAASVRPGANVRLKGEEFACGDVVIPAGTLLTPAWTGLAASLGRAELAVRRVRVAVFATGDELTAPGRPLPAGRVYNANSATVCALLRHWGAEAVDLGILPDDPAVIRDALRKAVSDCDILVASGGLGEGEHDYTNRLLTELGCGVTHHHVAMRPGKPFSFGRFSSPEGRWFMALPGNPVAAAVSATLFLQRAVRLASGCRTPGPEAFPAVAAVDVKGRKGRTDLVRGRIERTPEALAFRPLASQGSGMLTTLAGADAMAVLDEETDRVEAGTIVRCLPLG